MRFSYAAIALEALSSTFALSLLTIPKIENAVSWAYSHHGVQNSLSYIIRDRTSVPSTELASKWSVRSYNLRMNR